MEYPRSAMYNPLRVAARLEMQEQSASAPTREAAARRDPPSVDWLVVGQIVRKGKTPCWSPALCSTAPIGLRDRALIDLMVDSFARIGAALSMKIEDIQRTAAALGALVRERRQASRNALPPQPRNVPDGNLEKTGMADDFQDPLFRTVCCRTKQLTCTPLSQPDAYRMIERRTGASGIETKIGNHIPGDWHHGVFEERRNAREAANIANHASTRTTQLYDRRSDEVTLDEVERVGI